MVHEEYIGLADKPTYLEIAQSLNGILLFVIIIFWKEIIRKEIEDTLQEVLADLKTKSKFFRQELKTSSISHEMVDNYCERKGRR